jgi:antitoxin PrlF
MREVAARPVRWSATIIPYDSSFGKEIMSTATLTTKGQTTIPKEIREGMSLEPGDTLDFHLLSDASATIRVRRGTLKDFIGVIHEPGRKAVGVAEGDAAIAASMKHKHKRR